MKIRTRGVTPIGQGSGAHCHFLIAKTAKGMAHELYDICMKDNSIWAQWKASCPDLSREWLEEKFVEKLWPRLIEQARATLAGMLAMNYPDALKKEIYEALLLDNTLRRGRDKTKSGFRLGPPPAPGNHKLH